ncbi:MAG: hypothetical protein WCO52_02030 [bacterium]
MRRSVGRGALIMALVLCTAVAQAQTVPPETLFLGRANDLGNTTYVDNISQGRDDNPARLFDRGRQAGIKGGRIADRVLPDLQMLYAQGTSPVSKRWMVQLAGTRLTGSGPFGPGTLSYRDKDAGLQVAYRAGNRLDFGVGVADIETVSQIKVGGIGGFTLTSQPRGLGGRVGARYRLSPRIELEGTYDHYGDAERTVPLGAFAPLGESTAVFTTQKMVVGGSYRAKGIEAAMFYTKLDIDQRGGPFSLGKNFLNGGVKATHGPFYLAAGMYDGYGSVGAGMARGKTSLTVAASNRNKAFSPTAKTAYYAEAVRGF